jgi:Ca2+-binding RTX toxin-like protein
LDSTVSLNITATDAGGLSLSKGFTVNVTNVNEVPIVATLIPDYYTTLNTAQTFSIVSSFADPDAGTTPTYSVTSGTLPSGMTFNAATGTFSGTPTAIGAVGITVRATDGGGLFVEDIFRFSVSSTGSTGTADFLDYRGRTTGQNVNAQNGSDTVYGSAFADTINGGSGHDAIYGGGGNDLLTSRGNGDNDVFWYNEANGGNDTITDFTDGRDLIGFVAATTGVSSFGNLSTSLSGGNVLVSWNTGISQGSTLLQGITSTNLITAADFIFA